MGIRSEKLFGTLPMKVQLALGQPLNSDIWASLLQSSDIPAYLKEVDIDVGKSGITRNRLNTDTHLLENHAFDEGNGLDDDVDITSVLSGQSINFLKHLYNNDSLVKKEWDSNQFFKELSRNTQKFESDTESEDLFFSSSLFPNSLEKMPVPSKPVRQKPGSIPRKPRMENGILVENIITEKRRPKKNVSFAS